MTQAQITAADHSLEHALTGCEHEMDDIANCVLCGRRLDAGRQHVDTCSEFCFRRLLAIQRNSYRRDVPE